MEKFDVVVIGAGPGGYPAAIRAAQLGASTAVVEREQLGGTCLNWGCIPTKSLIASSSLVERVRHAGPLGVSAPDLSFDFEAMCAHKDAVVDRLRGGVAQLLKANGVTVLQGTGSFAERNRLRVTGPDGKENMVDTGATIIATGSTSTMPGFLPSSTRIVESRAFLARTTLPSSLLVLGGGVIGCEFACMAAQLGVDVTVVEMLDDILTVLDPDVRRVLRRHMEKALDIKVKTGAPLENIKATSRRVTGTFEEETLEADLVLVSVGRRPVTDGLALANAGLCTDDRGFLAVDATGRTAAATVYAVGDVTAGTTQLAHAATSQGLVAAENAVNGGRDLMPELVPACIFTSPEIASVGLTETRARDQGIAVTAGTFPFGALGKGLATAETDGFVKWIADQATGRLLGAHAVGPHATDLIAEPTAAIQAELTVAELAHTVHCHPTFAEAWMEAAHAVHGQCIHAAPKRR